MRAAILAFALVQGLTVAAYAATDGELRQKIVGRWGDTAACAEGILQFNGRWHRSSSLEKDGSPEASAAPTTWSTASSPARSTAIRCRR